MGVIFLVVNPGTGLILVEKDIPRWHVHIEKREPFFSKSTVLFFYTRMSE